MKKELIKLANHLDRIGRVKEANYIDNLLKKANSRDLFDVKKSYKTIGGIGEGINKYKYVAEVFGNLSRIQANPANKNLIAYIAAPGGVDDYKSLRMLFLYNGDIMSLSEEDDVLKRVYSVNLETMLRSFDFQIKEIEKIAENSRQHFKKFKEQNNDDEKAFDDKLDEYMKQGYLEVMGYYDSLKTKARFFDLRMTDDLDVIREAAKKLFNDEIRRIKTPEDPNKYIK